MLKPPECYECPLYSLGQSFSQPEGKGSTGVYPIGEALGFEEALDGLPFRPRAQAGSKLEDTIKIVAGDRSQKLTRQDFRLWNIVACRPPGNELVGKSYEKEAIRNCSRHFNTAIFGTNSTHLTTTDIRSNTSHNNMVARVFLALGHTPLTTLTGVTGEGKQSISYLRGFVLPYNHIHLGNQTPWTESGIPTYVVGSYHPSFLRRGNQHLTPLAVEDMKLALDVTSGAYTNHYLHNTYKPPSYHLHPTVDEFRSFYYHVKDNPRLVLTYDIETTVSAETDEDERDEVSNVEAEIIQFQFSVGKDSGWAVPYNLDYQDIIQALLELPNVKAGHNVWQFDNPIIQARLPGLRLDETKIHDTMWMFKHWHSRLPRGLQSVASLFGFPFPWKHLFSSQLEYYGCADVDAPHYILNRLPQLMKARGVWDGYVNHVFHLHAPTLTRAQATGIPVNETKRLAVQEKFKELRKELNAGLQKAIPDQLRNIRPRRKNKTTGEVDYGYIREPPIVRKEFDRYTELCSRLQNGVVAEEEPQTRVQPIPFADYLFRKHGIVYAEFERTVEAGGRDDRDYQLFETGDTSNTSGVGAGESNGTEKISRWCKIEPFKASSQQLVRYLRWRQDEISKEIDSLIEAREKSPGGRNPEITAKLENAREMYKAYEVPLTLKTRRPTTNKKEIEEMYEKTGDRVLESVVKTRSLDTNLNNYLPGWRPGPDGAVHTTFGFTASSGQLDSRRPNILNCSKHTEFGKEFRGIIEAPEGYCFVEFDKKSFHVATMGYCANDASYIRFSQLDPHSVFGSHINPEILGTSISMGWTDADIMAASKEFKKKCKAAAERNGLDVRQALAKPTVLGNQLGLGARKLQYQNRKFIHSLEHAQQLQTQLAQMFSSVHKFKDSIRQTAHLQRFLMNPFGFIQYFYDVFNFSWNKKKGVWDAHPGDDSEKAIAFPVQSNAFGMIQREILEMETMELCIIYNFINTIHDSVIFMPRVSERDRCIEQVYGIMTQPCQLLVNEATGPEGLRVGVEVAVGKNWKEMEEIKI